MEGSEFLPGIDSYGEFRSRLEDAEESEKISKKHKVPNIDELLGEDDETEVDESTESEDNS